MPGFHEDTFPVPKILVDWLGWLSTSQIVVLLILLKHYQETTPEARGLSVSNLMETTGLTRGTILTALEELKKRKIVKSEIVFSNKSHWKNKKLYYLTHILLGKEVKIEQNPANPPA